MKRKTRFLPYALFALPLATVIAQTTSALVTPTSSAVPAGDVIELSSFTVDASKDKGYRAENTLAGSRLNTALRDTAAPVSVFTEEFLEDLAITNVDQLIEYSVGTRIDVQDTGPGTDANNHIGGANIVRRLDIRGIRASESLDYFRSITPNDSYRIGRYDESRGPNGILFGISSAGGLINQSSILTVEAAPAGMNARDFAQQHQRAELQRSIAAARRHGAGLKR